ncbi:MAG: VOC family protein, partial [Actinomycetota bacterium]
WYATLGFWELFSMPGQDGSPMLIHLRRHKYQDILLVPGEAAGRQARPGLTVSFAAADDDLDAIASAARASGAGSVEGPLTRPWNSVELVCTDPVGNVVVLTQPVDTGRSFDEVMDAVRTAQDG